MLEIERGIHKSIRTIIDVSRISGLDQIRISKEGQIRIGALVTHNQVVRSDIIREHATCLMEACYQVGSPQIRNRGTVVGNLVTASPANDTIPALVALGAKVLLVSEKGERFVSVEDLYTGVRKTVIQNDEFLKEIVVDIKSGARRSTFSKLGFATHRRFHCLTLRFL